MVMEKRGEPKEISGAEAIAPLFEGAITERRCCSEDGEGCCCGEE